MDLVGMADVGKMLAVSAETTRRWRRWGLLPEPDEHRDDGVPLWRRETIIFWAVDRMGRTSVTDDHLDDAARQMIPLLDRLADRWKEKYAAFLPPQRNDVEYDRAAARWKERQTG